LVDKLLTAKVPFPQYAAASVTVVAAHLLAKSLARRSAVAARWLAGRPESVIKSGALVHRGMRSERVNRRSVLSALRTRGVRDARTIKAADLEISGEVSAMKEEWASDAQMQDLPRLGARRPSE
jgi:uncharacterized membrane protein YcaP (DUF421 family)